MAVDSDEALQTARAQMRALAAYLVGERDAILQRWRTGAGSLGESPLGSSLTRLPFPERLPGVLDALAYRLQLWPVEPGAPMAQDRGQPAPQGGVERPLRDCARAWGRLHLSLMEELESYALAHPALESRVMPAARQALAHVCWEGLAESAAPSGLLHQATSGQAGELEQALTGLGDIDGERTRAWRKAAHDLRGGVAVVKGATSLLERKDIPDPMRLKFIEMLQRGASSLHDMLDDLMNLARLDAGQEQRHIARFDAAIVLADFCTSALPMARARGLFLNSHGPASLMVEGDRDKIQHIVRILSLNALKHTTRGGITLIWEARDEGDSEAWMFRVDDTGPGLEPGARPREESGLARAQPLTPGPMPAEGVGLSIVQRLCQLLDARLEVQTRPGEGSSFLVILPRRYVLGVK